MDQITKALAEHYSEKFSLHGPSPEGVDWGPDESRMLLRYEKMLNVGNFSREDPASLLDVGCGFGGLQQFATANDIKLDYTGIDIAGNMIQWASENVSPANFICGDILECTFDRQFDYVVCNGILTQKLATAGLEMDQYAAKLIRRMFSLCTIGIAFNVMTTKVNYYSNNLYYRNPAELLAWCLNEISPYIKVDHSYPLYEYTIYSYRMPV